MQAREDMAVAVSQFTRACMRYGYGYATAEYPDKSHIDLEYGHKGGRAEINHQVGFKTGY
jgi:hypothetical protein